MISLPSFYDDVLKALASQSPEKYGQILFYISRIIDNHDRFYKKIAGEPVKSIKDRLVGKKELLRGHMLGKRCNSTARTVLGPNREFGVWRNSPSRHIANKTYCSRTGYCF